MEAADKRLHPSLPANYVTLVDLRESWMQRQKQKERDDNVNGDRDLQRSVEVRVDRGDEGEDDQQDQQQAADKRFHPPLPANYVSLVDLRERWMQRQKQKGRDDVNGDRDLQQSVEVRVHRGAKGEDDQQQKPLQKSVVRSNPNPNFATQRPSRRDQISQPKQKPKLPRVRTIQTGPAPVVRVVEAKPPPFDAAKVESVVEPREGHSSGNKVNNQKLYGPKMEVKEKIGPQRSYKGGKFHSLVDDHEKNGVRVVLGPNVEIEGKFGGVSLNSRPGECSGSRSVVVRNRNGWIRGRHGSIEGRTKRESGRGLVWVKKGEGTSEIGDAPNS